MPLEFRGTYDQTNAKSTKASTYSIHILPFDSESGEIFIITLFINRVSPTNNERGNTYKLFDAFIIVACGIQPFSKLIPSREAITLLIYYTVQCIYLIIPTPDIVYMLTRYACTLNRFFQQPNIFFIIKTVYFPLQFMGSACFFNYTQMLEISRKLH
jgi:hypothetical protein